MVLVQIYTWIFGRLIQIIQSRIFEIQLRKIKGGGTLKYHNKFTEILQTIRKYFKHSNFMSVFYLNKMESWETKTIINYQ